MSVPYVTRSIQWMDVQPVSNGLMPTLWDEDGEGRVKVGVEVYCDLDGKPEMFHVSSDDNHVMHCEQFPGREDLTEDEDPDHDRLGHD